MPNESILTQPPRGINYRPGPDSPNPDSVRERHRKAHLREVARKAWEDAGKIQPVEPWELELAKGGDHNG